MSRRIYEGSTLVETWDDDSRTHRRYEAGEVVASRPYTYDEEAAVSPVPQPAVVPELLESFGKMPDGPPPPRTASGHAVVNFSPVAAAAPYVRNGFMSTTTPSSAEGGSYRIAQLGGPAVRIGARFAFTPWTTAGGLLCLSIQAANISNSPSVPVSPVHFYITPTSWVMDVNDTAGTSVETVASAALKTPLTTDGATLYTVEVVLDRQWQRSHVTLPDGSVVTLTDPRFALPGTWVYVEPYKSLGPASGKTNALVREWWADAGWHGRCLRAGR